MNKKYKLGLYLGRFQPLHIGHTSIIDQMLEDCEHIVIAIGSASSSGTERNPLMFHTRAQHIQEVYSDKLHRITIVPMYDRKVYSDDNTWGIYVMDSLKLFVNTLPDVIYEGDDSVNTSWWEDCNAPVIRVSRKAINISGTELRSAIKSDRKEFALSYLPVQIHKYYDSLRKEIQNGTVD